MKNAGVKVLFIDQMPEAYASALLKDLVQQNFHPKVVLGAATYSHALIPASGGAAAVNGSYLDQNASLYLGEDQIDIPAVGTFLHWVNVADPGFKTDLFTLYGWLSGRALRPGPEERRLRSEPGVDPPGPGQDHLVQRWQHRHHLQPGGPDHVELLPDRHGDQRPVGASRRSRRSAAPPTATGATAEYVTAPKS